MALPKQIWDQLRATPIEDFISALERDGFARDNASAGAVQAFIRKEKSGNRRVVLHYHPGKTWGAKFLKGLIDDAGWTLGDLVRLGFVTGIKKDVPSPTVLVACDCDRGIIGDGQPCPECGGTSFREVPALPPH